ASARSTCSSTTSSPPWPTSDPRRPDGARAAPHPCPSVTLGTCDRGGHEMGTRRSVVRTAGRPVLLLSALLTAAAACGRSDGSDDDPRADTSATSPADSTQPAPPDEVPWRDALTERYVPDLADADAARYCSVDQRWKGIRWTTEEPAWRTNAELQRSLL